MMAALIAHGPRHHQQHGRTHALPSGSDDIFTNSSNKDDFRIKTGAYHSIQGFHVVCDGGEKLGETQNVIQRVVMLLKMASTKQGLYGSQGRKNAPLAGPSNIEHNN